LERNVIIAPSAGRSFGVDFCVASIFTTASPP
jgi:hypothetical protein